MYSTTAEFFEALAPFPQEVKDIPQWVLWREVLDLTDPNAKPKKVPHHMSGYKVNPHDPSSWLSFEDAVHYAVAKGFGVGFVLTENTPYSVIDLDWVSDEVRRAQNEIIYIPFNSYAEESPGRQGLHIWVRGKTENCVYHQGGLEIYSTDRFMTVTGRVVNNVPIQERTDMLWLLRERVESMTARSKIDVHHDSVEQTLDDSAIINRAASAANGERFRALWAGNWRDAGRFPSPSEADFALINMLGFYTENHEQVVRLFKQSKLYRPQKYDTRFDLIANMVRRSYDKTVFNLDISALQSQYEKQFAEKQANPIRVTDTYSVEGIAPPPGALGAIARFVHQSSTYPLPDVSVITALGFAASIIGSSYCTPTGAGLNLYLLLTAPTGAGKDAINSSINKLLDAMAANGQQYQQYNVANSAPFMAATDILAPRRFSPEALVKLFNHDFKSKLVVWDEFGYRLQEYMDPRANARNAAIKGVLLQAYSDSTPSHNTGGMAYSDKEKDVKLYRAPALSIVGMSAPGPVYDNLDTQLVDAGLIPRFVLFEVPRIEDHYAPDASSIMPTVGLVLWLRRVAMEAAKHAQVGTPGRVAASVDVQEQLEKYRKEFRFKTQHEQANALWQRAHLNIMKIASICAVLDDPINPIINMEHLEWARMCVVRGCNSIAGRIERGEIGSTDASRVAVIQKFLQRYMQETKDTLPKVRFDAELQAKGIISHAYLMQNVCSLAAFREGRKSQSDMFTSAIRILMDRGELIEEMQSKEGPVRGRPGRYYRIVVH